MTAELPTTDLVVLLAYVAMVCTVIPFHEPWRDEAQAWLLSRDLSLYSLLFQHLRYEGHPALWYLVLWVPAHLGLPFAALSCISAAFSTAAVWVLLRYSPFPAYLRCLIPFTFYFGYQYPVVARSYCLFPLLIFLAAHEYRQPESRPVRMAMWLSLLANVSLHGTLVALTFAGLYFWKVKRQDRGRELKRESARRDLTAVLIFSGSMLFVLICLWPPRDLSPTLSPGWHRLFQRLAIPPTAPATVPRAQAQGTHPSQPTSPAAQAPSPAYQPPASSVVEPIVPAEHSSRFQQAAFVLSYPIATSRVLAGIAYFFLIAYCAQKRQIKFLLPVMLLVLFFTFVFMNYWHEGMLLATVVAVLWAVWNERIELTGTRLQTLTAGYFAFVCMLQVMWTLSAIRYDIRQTYSPEKPLALYLRAAPQGTRMAAFADTTAVLAYFDHQIFFNQSVYAFKHYGPSALPTIPQTLAAAPDLVVAKDPRIIAVVVQAGYTPVRSFCGQIFAPHSDTKRACFTVLTHDGSGPRQSAGPLP